MPWLSWVLSTRASSLCSADIMMCTADVHCVALCNCVPHSSAVCFMHCACHAVLRLIDCNVHCMLCVACYTECHNALQWALCVWWVLCRVLSALCSVHCTLCAVHPVLCFAVLCILIGGQRNKDLSPLLLIFYILQLHLMQSTPFSLTNHNNQRVQI